LSIGVKLGILVSIFGIILASIFYISLSEPISITSTDTTTITESLTSTEKTTQVTSNNKIIISLPFEIRGPPDGIMPMGETLEHEASYGGHPGIDFQWHNYIDENPIILASASGVISKVTKDSYSNYTSLIVVIIHEDFNEKYYTLYEGLTFNFNFKVGDRIERDDFLGYAYHPHEVPDPGYHMIHWEFGFLEDDQEDRLCPMTYFDDESKELLERIWSEPHSYAHKDQFPHICSGFYQGKNE
tara:strand:- start:60 stop:788 length:729 start_codon:yes stop_codon:yes gene_type:complete